MAQRDEVEIEFEELSDELLDDVVGGRLGGLPGVAKLTVLIER